MQLCSSTPSWEWGWGDRSRTTHMYILSPNSGATAINPYWPIWSIETVPALTKPIAQITAQKEMVISQGLARYPQPHSAW